jgi:lipopolysaccharide export system permease protein
MILIELIKVFALALVALTGLILLAGIISEAMKNGLGPGQILVAVPLLLPSLLPYTVPTTTLFATCIVYGRLAADNEVVALKAAGTHVFHLLWPAAVLGVAATAVTVFISLDVIPYTHFLLRAQAGGDTEELLYAMIRRDGLLRHPKLTHEIHVERIQGRTLHGVVFKRLGAGGAAYDIIACAREAELRVDWNSKQILVDMRHCTVEGALKGFFERRAFPFDLTADWSIVATKVRAADMTWGELAHYETHYRDERDKLDADIARHQTQIERGRAAPHIAEHVMHLSNERRIRNSYVLAIGNERHQRPALALGCLCFALVGCPVGIWLSRSDYLSAFVACFLPIVTIYYPLLFLMINLTRSEKAPVVLGMHGANALTFMVGALLLWRLGRH